MSTKISLLIGAYESFRMIQSSLTGLTIMWGVCHPGDKSLGYFHFVPSGR